MTCEDRDEACQVCVEQGGFIEPAEHICRGCNKLICPEHTQIYLIDGERCPTCAAKLDHVEAA